MRSFVVRGVLIASSLLVVALISGCDEQVSTPVAAPAGPSRPQVDGRVPSLGFSIQDFERRFRAGQPDPSPGNGKTSYRFDLMEDGQPAMLVLEVPAGRGDVSNLYLAGASAAVRHTAGQVIAAADPTLPKEKIDRLISRLARRARGADSLSKPPMVEGGLRYNSSNMDDLGQPSGLMLFVEDVRAAKPE
jgi:hypothetical protein